MDNPSGILLVKIRTKTYQNYPMNTLLVGSVIRSRQIPDQLSVGKLGYFLEIFDELLMDILSEM